jgi:sterol desaturase/sphingolipid hydroxylase (fatty acid hydroxylase superfamily)
MSELLNYFQNIPSSHRTAFLLGGLVMFLFWEFVLPALRFSYNKWRHAGVNIFFTLTTALVNLSLASFLVVTAYHTSEIQFGLLHLVDLPIWLNAIIGLLLLDLIGAYFVHWVEHKVPVLWRFHIVHHTDKHVDTTTANRHHPGESMLRLAFTVLAVWVSGASLGLVLLYQSLSVLLSQFNHANIRLPHWLDFILRLVIVTPAMHRVHHHYQMPITDTNYGNIFSFWDRIFGTYIRVLESELVFGLDTHFQEKDSENIGRMLKIPFVRRNPATKDKS